jgi:Zn-dependent protease
MRDLLSWNLSLGRWAGVHVRLHVFFLLFALFALHFGAREQLLGYTCLGLLILLASAVAHEFGHCVAAWKVGGAADQVLIWPLGGLTHVNVSQEPQNELVTSMAGPLVNICICMLLAPVLVLFQYENVLSLLNPLEPPIPATGKITWITAAALAFWCNWLLALVNFLPAFPLDGGRALRAMLWRPYGFRIAVEVVVRSAKLVALVLWVVSLLVWETYPFASLPLAIFGLFLFFSAKQEAERLHEQDSGDGLFGYDFSQGYTSLEKHYQSQSRRSPGPLRKWLDARRAARLERQHQIEVEEERRVDEILARLQETGMEGLSDEERALLDRVSARYRNRLRG